ncbi:MAG: DUF4160 domain-containing protein [Ignavibacteria bacterium]|nr:DUF4160 domain-containing protein [Ignavibacteria bacterium]MBK8383133.1 DUF4160 domain-containing protein [Ignavibacteria bacterium]MBK9402981.1 DUF4160 domain-containing protein [Ignavibacteria bacterium]
MPKLFEYFGLIVLFYSNEHDPIHVHGKFQDKECKAEIEIVNGKIIKISFKNVKGKKPLTKTKLDDFKIIVKKHSEYIVKSWIDFFVFNKPIQSKTITRRIK